MRELRRGAQALPASGQAKVPVPLEARLERWPREAEFVLVAFRSGLLEEGIAQGEHVEIEAGIEIVAVGVGDVLVFVGEGPGARTR